MTEGAKTGTPTVILTMKETARYYHQRADEVRHNEETTSRFNYMLAQAQVYEQCACLAEEAITEALKVAGEAETAFKALLDDMTQRAKDIAEYNDKPVELPVGNGVLFEARKALAALERIRNNKH